MRVIPFCPPPRKTRKSTPAHILRNHIRIHQVIYSLHSLPSHRFFTQSCREAEFAANFQLSASVIFDADCTNLLRFSLRETYIWDATGASFLFIYYVRFLFIYYGALSIYYWGELSIYLLGLNLLSDNLPPSFGARTPEHKPISPTVFACKIR